MKYTDLKFLETDEGIEEFIDSKMDSAIRLTVDGHATSGYVPFITASAGPPEIFGDPFHFSVFNTLSARELAFVNKTYRQLANNLQENPKYPRPDYAPYESGGLVITEVRDDNRQIVQEYFYLTFMVEANGKKNPVFACIKAFEREFNFVEYLTVKRHKILMAAQQDNLDNAMLFIYGFPTMDNVVIDRVHGISANIDYYEMVKYKRWDEFGYYLIPNAAEIGTYSTFGESREDRYYYFDELKDTLKEKNLTDQMVWRLNDQLDLIESIMRSDFMFWAEKNKDKFKIPLNTHWEVYKHLRSAAANIADYKEVNKMKWPEGEMFEIEDMFFQDMLPMSEFIFGPAFSMMRYAMDVKSSGALPKQNLAFFNTEKFRKIIFGKEWAEYAVHQKGMAYVLFDFTVHSEQTKAKVRLAIQGILMPIMEAYLKERWDNFRHIFSISENFFTGMIGDRRQSQEMMYNFAQLNYNLLPKRSNEGASDLVDQIPYYERTDFVRKTQNVSSPAWGRFLFFDKSFNFNPQIQYKGQKKHYRASQVIDATFNYWLIFLAELFSMSEKIDNAEELQPHHNPMFLGHLVNEDRIKYLSSPLWKKIFRPDKKGDATTVDYGAIYQWLRYEIPADPEMAQLIASIVYTPFIERTLTAGVRVREVEIVGGKDKSYRGFIGQTLEVTEAVIASPNPNYPPSKKFPSVSPAGMMFDPSDVKFKARDVAQEVKDMHAFLRKIAPKAKI